MVKRRKDDDDLRPEGFDGYIGQEAVKSQLEIAMEAANERKDVLDHILIYGPPGYGKTTLANIIATEMKARLLKYLGGNLRSAKDMNFLRTTRQGDQIFIDEVHRMWVPAAEMLYLPMEEGMFAYKVDGLQLTTNLPPFTVIGATTVPEKLERPFKDRFGFKFELVPYSLDEMKIIVQNSASKLELTITEDGAKAVATRSGGTPRVANMMVRRLRDYGQYHDVKLLDEEFVSGVLDLEGLKWQV